MAIDIAVDLQQSCGMNVITEEAEAKIARLHLVAKLNIDETNNSQQDCQTGILESVGERTRDIAHQLNNVLSIIYGHADLMEDSIGPHDALIANVASIRAAGFRAADLARQLNLVRDMINDRVAASKLPDLPGEEPSKARFPILQPWKFENWGFLEASGAF